MVGKASTYLQERRKSLGLSLRGAAAVCGLPFGTYPGAEKAVERAAFYIVARMVRGLGGRLVVEWDDGGRWVVPEL